MENVKVGIIGTGSTIGIARSHINGLKDVEDCTLAALYDIAPGRAQKYVDDLKLGIAAFDDFELFLKAVDAAIICTPNRFHVEIMEKCLAAGKHVICEKPLAHNLREAEKVLNFDKKYPDLVKMVVFNYREMPTVALVKDLIDEGKLGRIFMFRYIIGGNRIGDKDKVKLEWRMQKALSGTGALADFGCHVLDLIDYMVSPSMGKIKEVGCFCETFVNDRADIETGDIKKVSNDDLAVMIARTEGGCLCSITVCRLQIPYASIELIGEGGTISYMQQGEAITTHFKPLNGAFSSPPQQLVIDEKYKKMAGHVGVLSEFINCIKTGAKPVRNMEHGLYIQKLLDAYERSAETKTMIQV